MRQVSELPDYDQWHEQHDREFKRKQMRANRLRLASLKRRRKNILHLSIVAAIAGSMYIGQHAMADGLFLTLAALVEVY